ncbi:hypothetical protein EYC80_001839 [Monilinia laxa]|uniref:Uncharacterized protein n=1 Tax=Monilinia laxa TaxID=61186 RepID=A0A5N6K665_MONLA|nr:hypothetical protein EYC80_001839 [Monilinia laxa]
MTRASPTKDSQSRSILHRRESNNNLLAHAPLPDLVALYQSRMSFTNSIGEAARATREDMVDNSGPFGTQNVQRKRKRNFENQYNSISGDAYAEKQKEDKENGLVDDGQPIAAFPPHLAGSNFASSSTIAPYATFRAYQSVPSRDFEPTKRATKSMQDRHQQKRLRPNPLITYRPIKPKLKLITCSTTLEALSNNNSRMDDSPTPSTYSPKSENCSPTYLRNYTPFSHYRYDSSETDMSSQDEANSPEHSTGNTEIAKKPQELGSPFQFRPRQPKAPSTPQYRSTSPRYYSPQPQRTPSNQYELPEPGPLNLTYQEYIRSILSLRADTADPSQYPLPQYLDLNNAPLCALQMEAVEDQIHLDGVPDDYEDVYYQQFAEEEF